MADRDLIDARELFRLVEAKDSMAKANTPEPFSKSKTSNWVAKLGGLPPYIQHVAHGLVERGKTESEAIKMAIGIIKNWASGKGKVDANTRAAASKALAQWAALKAKNAAKKVGKKLSEADECERWIIAIEEGAQDAADTLDAETLAECAAAIVLDDMELRILEARAAGRSAASLDEAWSPAARAAALLARKKHSHGALDRDPVGARAVRGLRADDEKWKASDAKQKSFEERLEAARARGEMRPPDHREAARVLGDTHPLVTKLRKGEKLSAAENAQIHDAIKRRKVIA